MSVISLLQTPLVLYTATLAVVWLFLQVVPDIIRADSKLNLRISSRLIYAVFTAYALLAIFFMAVDVHLFPYLHSAMLAFLLMILLGSPQRNSKFLLLVALWTALMPVVVMTATRHPLPLGDDARFIGFANAIERDGRWVPFKYQENPYYQPFHLIPYLEYVLAVLPGFDLGNIASYYLILKFGLYFTYFLSIYLVMKNLTNDNSASLLAMLLLSITPPLALAQIVHQAYAIVLFLTTFLVFIKKIKMKLGLSQDTLLLTIIILWVTGIVAHATYTVMFLTFALPLALTREKISKKNVALLSALLVLTSVAYWTYTYIMDIIVRPTANAVTRLIDLLTGRTPLSPFHGTAKPWYSSSTFFIAWSLAPSITASYVLFSIMWFRRRKYSWGYIGLLGVIGLSGIAINYVLRTLPTFGGRYFYWLYLLMIPLATNVVKKTSTNPLSLIFSIVLISLIAFYGIQDPTMSASTYGDYIGWADRTSWYTALELQPYLSSKASKWIDPRLFAPLNSIIPPPFGEDRIRYSQKIAVIGTDKIGLTAISKDPRNEDWFTKNFGTYPFKILQILNNTNVILNINKYIGMWKGV